ncbi:small integral membrane protein 27 isoform X1 [Mesocricetus auratus]|uniref:Small integral membrane protein 27 isoform X1 n=1 Tax=Mesocricetus auratus TaxID=10036 RepID=A0ABM2X5U0_MESAU|nr:small integral membrane protein 27 isoform X1 [Mesocricetus auratus]
MAHDCAALRLEETGIEKCLCKRKKKARFLTFSPLFPPQPERRARPGSRDALYLRAEARLGPRKDGCRSGADGSRARALGPRHPRLLPPYHEARESPHPGLDLLRVAACDRLALLGIRHLCISCSCTTTVTEDVSRQIL